MAKEGKITAGHTMVVDGYMLTAKTADLQAFVLKYANEPKAFVDTEVWTKKL
jgi:hypothetical protein